MPEPTAPSRIGRFASPRSDRRQTVRRRAGEDTMCRLFLAEDANAQPARLENLSEGGARIQVDRAVSVGDALTVELANSPKNFTCRRDLRVVYVIRRAPGGCSFGGVFAETLQPQEVQRLL